MVKSFEQAPPEARELLSRRISDLGLQIVGTPLEPMVERLYGELAAKELHRFRPVCYLSDEWSCPDREPIIGIPFYLANAHLREIERAANDLEDDRDAMMYLRHEAGHAFNYAYELFNRRDWVEQFGPFDRPYVDDYRPVPFSRRFVRHIAGWYAQKHPDEDFAETFAVWLTPGSEWRQRYAGWPVLAKLEYVEAVARELSDRDPTHALAAAVAETPVEQMEMTVEEFYREHRVDETLAITDLAVDGELCDIFAARGPIAAAAFVARHRKALLDKIAYWTGLRRSLVGAMLDTVEARSGTLNLRVEEGAEERTLVELAAFATTLSTNYLHRGAWSER
ncbi:MAG TPA: hypothetical protein VED59_07740 [Acidimicrobiales bacterium]|nr:hypothetical protein [Acidimicrobiales bacterium]